MKGTVAGIARRRRDRRRTSRPASRRTACRPTARSTLEPSTIGGLEITRASLDGSLSRLDRRHPRARHHRPRRQRQGSGTLALNDTGQSNLNVHADSPSLAEIGKLVDQPLDRHRQDRRDGDRQQARAEGVRHARRRRREVRRQRRADGVEHVHRGGAGADGRRRQRRRRHARDVRLGRRPGDQRARRRRRPTSRSSVDFDATAKQPQRSLGAAGSLVLHPDHQEVHLQQLGAADAGADLAAGAGIGGDDQLRARRGRRREPDAGQRRAADRRRRHVRQARRRAEGDADATSISASVDALLLRPPQLTGTLNASATVTGTDRGARREGASSRSTRAASSSTATTRSAAR